MLSGISQSSQMASQLFSRIDTKSQGYIEKSDLATAFSQISAKASDTTSVDDVFAALDSDSNGQVTESEFSSVLSQLQEQLDSQFSRMRMEGKGGSGGPQGMAGMPPPPPPSDDAGFTEEELTSQLEEIGSTDTQRSSLISNIVDNFEAADSDGDGKVSFKEAMAFDEASKSATSSFATSTSSSTDTAQAAASTDAQVMMKIMKLMHAYGSGQDQQQSGVASLLSAIA